LRAATLTHVENLTPTAGHSYTLKTHGGNLELGRALKVNAGTLGSNDLLTFDGSAEREARVHAAPILNTAVRAR
jgi:hypothetical protein